MLIVRRKGDKLDEGETSQTCRGTEALEQQNSALNCVYLYSSLKKLKTVWYCTAVVCSKHLLELLL